MGYWCIVHCPHVTVNSIIAIHKIHHIQAPSAPLCTPFSSLGVPLCTFMPLLQAPPYIIPHPCVPVCIPLSTPPDSALCLSAHPSVHSAMPSAPCFQSVPPLHAAHDPLHTPPCHSANPFMTICTPLHAPQCTTPCTRLFDKVLKLFNYCFMYFFLLVFLYLSLQQYAFSKAQYC